MSLSSVGVDELVRNSDVNIREEEMVSYYLLFCGKIQGRLCRKKLT